jgi:hypothetical protein
MYGYSGSDVVTSFAMFNRVANNIQELDCDTLSLDDDQYAFVQHNLNEALWSQNGFSVTQEFSNERVVSIRKKLLKKENNSVETYYELSVTDEEEDTETRTMTWDCASLLLQDISTVILVVKIAKDEKLSRTFFGHFFGLCILRSIEADSAKWSSLFKNPGALEDSVQTMFVDSRHLLSLDAARVSAALNACGHVVMDCFDDATMSHIIRKTIQDWKLSGIVLQIF